MLKVAIVYDRVNKWGGAERVLLALHEIFPKATLYTSVYDQKGAPWAKVFTKIETSFLQKIPFMKSNHEFLAIFMPLVFSLFDFSKYDLVISVTSESAKGVRTKGRTLHVCYCLTPTRYLWSGYNEYFKGRFFRTVTKPVVDALKWWDKLAADRPNIMLSISTEVQKRIKKYYKRNSVVIYPPVDITKHQSSISNNQENKKYYLLVSRLDFGYKKVDLAIKVFNKLGYPLVIVGTGREEKRLKKLSSHNIFFAGKVSEKELTNFYLGAKALIMPQEEDFGIVSVEAQSFGVPIIAYKKGGSLDTVIEGKTGIFFDKQSVKSLEKTVKNYNNHPHKNINAKACTKNAKRFSKDNFKRGFVDLVKNARMF